MMRRLGATLGCDVRLQARNGFYYAAAVVIVIWLMLLAQIPRPDRALVLPAIVLTNLVIGTYYFVGGLVLLEKGEGTLEALVVTPLRRSEYLVSKVTTLTALGVIESFLIAALGFGRGFAAFPLVVGIVACAVPYTLFGFLAVVRYDSINEYLFPSFLVTILLVVPLLPYFGVVESNLFYLHPLQGGMTLLEAAFRPVEPWRLGVSALGAIAWSGVVFAWSLHVFQRFIIRREGVR